MNHFLRGVIEQFPKIHRHLAVLWQKNKLPFALCDFCAHPFRTSFWKQVFLVLGVLGTCFFLFFLTGLGSVGVWGFEWFLVAFGSRAQGFRARFGILLFAGLRRQVFKCLFVSFVLRIVKTLTATPVCLWQFGSAPWGNMGELARPEFDCVYNILFVNANPI